MLKWTTDRPTKPGWYWFRCPNIMRPPEIVEVFSTGEQWHIDGVRNNVANLDGQWYGPLEVPA